MQRVLFVPSHGRRKAAEKQKRKQIGITKERQRYAVEGVKRKYQTTGVNWVCKACERASS
jgi:hypothetical protein